MNMANTAGVHKLSTSSEVYDLCHANAPFYSLGWRDATSQRVSSCNVEKNKFVGHRRVEVQKAKTAWTG